MSVTNECIPYQEPGERLPCSVLAEKSVVGKTFVKIADDMQGGNPNGLTTDVDGNNYQIEPAGAGDTPLGVASYNAAEGKKVTVLASPGMVVPVTAGEALEAGDLISVGAAGVAVKATALKIEEEKVKTAASVVAGMALADAAKEEDVPVKLA